MADGPIRVVACTQQLRVLADQAENILEGSKAVERILRDRIAELEGEVDLLRADVRDAESATRAADSVVESLRTLLGIGDPAADRDRQPHRHERTAIVVACECPDDEPTCH